MSHHTQADNRLYPPFVALHLLHSTLLLLLLLLLLVVVVVLLLLFLVPLLLVLLLVVVVLLASLDDFPMPLDAQSEPTRHHVRLSLRVLPQCPARQRESTDQSTRQIRCPSYARSDFLRACGDCTRGRGHAFCCYR
jgi:hypothetical protein